MGAEGTSRRTSGGGGVVACPVNGKPRNNSRCSNRAKEAGDIDGRSEAETGDAWSAAANGRETETLSHWLGTQQSPLTWARGRGVPDQGKLLGSGGGLCPEQDGKAARLGTRRHWVGSSDGG